MMDFRPVFLITGVLLMALAALMCIPAAVDWLAGNPDWRVFSLSALVTLFVGGAMTLTNRAGGANLSIHQAFALTALIWIVLTLFAALPLQFGDLDLSFTDAYFEAMSGITTTGSTVLTGLDHLPPGVLLWRGILQWLGGLGIIVMSISILPMLRVGGMQMFKVEAFETGGKALPRAAQISSGVTIIFVAVTAIWAFALWLAGMTGLEAAVHAMTTIATGGFSTSDASVAYFDSVAIDVIITIGMVVGGIPFVLYLKALRGDLQALVTDSQVHCYLGILAVAILACAVWLTVLGDYTPPAALRYAAFNVISVMTGTGFASADYMQWGAFPVGLLFFVTFVGGCAGSTTCGIKVFRFQILYSVAAMQLRKLHHPHGVFIARYNARPIDDEIVSSVLSYFFFFGACFAGLALGLNITGLDYVTAVSSAATAIANVGPGLGPIVGPAGNFQSLPDAAKWMLAAGMLIGRLEVFTVVILFTRSFWRG